MNRTLKSVFLASTIVLATSAGAFAASAWADGKTKLREKPYKWADAIHTIYDGEKVKLINCKKNKNNVMWCKVKHEGDTGFVRYSHLDFDKKKKDWDGDVDFEFGSGGFDVEIEFDF